MSVLTEPGGVPAVKTHVRSFVDRGIVNIDKALDEGTELSVIKRRHGEDVTTALLIVYITDLVDSFNVSRPMTDYQVADLAMDLVAEYWWLKLEELAAFFECVKRGQYGKVYERLDGPMIWQLLDSYLDHRTTVVETRRARKIELDLNTPEDPERNFIGTQVAALGNNFSRLKNILKDDRTME